LRFDRRRSLRRADLGLWRRGAATEREIRTPGDHEDEQGGDPRKRAAFLRRLGGRARVLGGRGRRGARVDLARDLLTLAERLLALLEGLAGGLAADSGLGDRAGEELGGVAKIGAIFGGERLGRAGGDLQALLGRHIRRAFVEPAEPGSALGHELLGERATLP